MRLFYLFDPLCGWCYGAKPVIEALAARFPVELVPTGLFFRSGRVMDAGFAEYAWGNDQRIERLTGQPFSPAYRTQILQGGGPFDSENSLLALTAVRETVPEKELTLLGALQAARYVEGRDNTDWSVIADVMQAQGLGDTVSRLHDPATEQTLLTRIQFGQQLAQRLGASGVPQLAVERGAAFELLPNQLFFRPAEVMVNELMSALA